MLHIYFREYFKHVKVDNSPLKGSGIYYLHVCYRAKKEESEEPDGRTHYFGLATS